MSIRLGIIGICTLMITQVALSTIGTVGGYGKELPMKIAMDGLVPKDWQIQTTRAASESIVSWVGNDSWDKVLASIAKQHNFSIKLDYQEKIVTIKELGKYRVLKPIKKKPTKPTKPKAKASPHKIEREEGKAKNQIKNINVRKKPTYKEKFMDDVADLLGINNAKNNAYKKSSTDIKVEALFRLMSIPATKIRTKTTRKERDNTVKIEIDFEIDGESQNTYIIFNGVSMYSPYMPKSMSLLVMDWYEKNFKHKIQSVASSMKPLSIEFEGDYIKELEIQQETLNDLTDEPEYIKKRDLLVAKGKMLSEVLIGWGKDVGVEIVWKADADYKIKKEIFMFDGFLQSVDSLIKFYNNTSSPIQTRFFVKNRVLLVENLRVVYRNPGDRK